MELFKWNLWYKFICTPNSGEWTQKSLICLATFSQRVSPSSRERKSISSLIPSSNKTKSLESQRRFLYPLMPRQLASARDYCGDIAFSCALSSCVSPIELASHDFCWLLSFNDVGRASDASSGLSVRIIRIFLIVIFTIFSQGESCCCPKLSRKLNHLYSIELTLAGSITSVSNPTPFQLVIF